MKRKPLSPAECDRWDTIPGVLKSTGSKPDPERQKWIDEFNAQRAAKAEEPEPDKTDYDRWGTPPNILRVTSKPTPEQIKLAAEINAQREAEAAEKAKGKK